jgi:hypothetical protein
MQRYSLKKYRCIEPAAVTQFLDDHGWEEIDKKEGIVSIWEIAKRDGTHYKILLPLNLRSPDYPNRMIEALKTVSIVESRDESDLVNNLLDNAILDSVVA